MASEQQHAFGEGVSYEDSLPLTWEKVEGTPSDSQLARLNEVDEQLLRLLSSIESRHESDDLSVSSDIVRLELKLDMILELIGQLRQEQMDLPHEVAVTLFHNGMGWHTPTQTGLSLKDRVTVSLYLDPALPRPLQLPGVIVQCESNEDGEYCFLVFDGLGETVQDAIQRLIFRHHRRAIALKKRQ